MFSSTTAKAIGRGLLVVVAILLLLGLMGYLYLTLNPPFAAPETGYLRSDMDRTVRLRPEAPVAVVWLDVRHDSRIFTDSRSRSAQFDPTRFTAAITDDGSETPIRVRLYPADGEPISGFSASADGRSASWQLDCQADEALDCPRRYLVAIGAESLDSEVVVRLSVAAELAFPTHVPTPFMVSIGLDSQEIAVENAGAGLRTTRAGGSTSVSPTMAVALHDLDFPTAQGTLVAEDGVPVAGTVLDLVASRDGIATPTGFHAPPPIRVAIVDNEGSVIVDVGIRPGTPTSVSLPPLEGEHRLVLWWQDRAADSYHVDWSVERGAVGSGHNLTVEAGDAVTPPSVTFILGESDAELEIGNPQSEVVFGFEIEVGEGGIGRLPPAAGVVRLSIELAADEATGPLILILTGGGAVPVTLEPGEPVDLALDALANCGAASCEPWHGQLVVPGQPFRTNAVHQSASISWSARWELWPLDPRAQSPIFREINR